MTIHLEGNDEQLRQAILAGDRGGLARGITLVESERADHQERAEKLVTALLPRTGQATRLGISGAPGVGKSTFVEAFGMHIVNAGHRVAVLAIDPSSRLSGGSILGDKTRMDELSRHPAAFVRPSSAKRPIGKKALPKHEQSTLSRPLETFCDTLALFCRPSAMCFDTTSCLPCGKQCSHVTSGLRSDPQPAAASTPARLHAPSSPRNLGHSR